MTTTQATISQRIADWGLTMDLERADHNPHMDDMPRGSAHYTCTIHADGETMVTPFSQGPAIIGPPDLATVLDCLASDASGYHNVSSFEEWAADYGYDIDSRKALATYEAVGRQYYELFNLLGSERFEALLYDTERE